MIYGFLILNLSPLKILSFTAKKESNNVLLNWQTANEINVSHFNIQHSLNGKEFTTIGNVNASCCTYSYSDKLISTYQLPTIIYYRLEIVDKDGSKTYSEIRNIEYRTRNNELRIFPNPATDLVVIESKGAKHLTITDCVGRTIEQLNIVSEHQTINTKQWSKGIYILSFDTGEKLKLVKD